MRTHAENGIVRFLLSAGDLFPRKCGRHVSGIKKSEFRKQIKYNKRVRMYRIAACGKTVQAGRNEV